VIDGTFVLFLPKVDLQFSIVKKGTYTQMQCHLQYNFNNCRLHVSSRMALRKRWISEDKIKRFGMTTDCDSARVYRVQVFSVHIPLRMAVFLSHCSHVCSKTHIEEGSLRMLHISYRFRTSLCLKYEHWSVFN
jgi:hypothetical protein